MGKRLQALNEAIFGEPKDIIKIEKGTVVLGQVEQSYGVRTSTSFADQVKVFKEDPVVKESILQSAQEICSTGFFTTFNEAYSLELPNPNKEGSNWNVKGAVDYFNKINNLDGKVLQIAVELIAFGNSFWSITDGGFVNIPVEAIEKAEAYEKNTPIREKYNLKTTAAYGSKTLKHGEFLHFHTEQIGNGPFGSGIILGLIAQPDDDTPSLYAIRKAVRAAMKEGFTKFSFGNELWVFEDLSDEQLTEVAANIVAMSSTGNRIATNKKGSIQLAVPQRTQSYDKWIEQVHFEFMMALANPSLKLGLEQGFTKATAEAARELYEMKISALRREIKRIIEYIWTKVLDKLGFDGQEANVRLHFGSQDIEYTTADIFSAVDKQVISKDEARTILREYLHWKLSSQSVEVKQ